jgi:hypothetical protein
MLNDVTSNADTIYSGACPQHSKMGRRRRPDIGLNSVLPANHSNWMRGVTRSVLIQSDIAT